MTQVLLYTQDLQEAKQEVAALGGRVTHQFTDNVIVADFPDSVDLQTLQHSTTAQPSSLDPVSLLAVNAWHGLMVRSLMGAAPSATEGLSWDTPGFSPPGHGESERGAVDQATALAENLPEESTGTPTSRYMIGSIAVGVVIVSGTGPGLAFSAAEQQQVVQEVQEGLNFLASVEPRANISFVYDIRLVTVSATPGPTDTYENAEAPWRNAALQQLGVAANRSGSVQYVQNLRSSRGTDWAYVGYFTKYPLHHFAYAVDEKLCMNYSNDGWGSNQINKVFAHESCHIFGAADEYGSCSCGGSHGHLGIPNNNCVNCAGGHVPCLMEANVLELCQWSRGQIGWDDRLLRGWSGWFALGAPAGGFVGAPPVISRNGSVCNIYVRGVDNALWQKAWFNNAWHDWGRHNDGGVLASEPALGSMGPNHEHVFVRGTDNQVWQKFWQANSGWSGWFALGAPPGGFIGAPSVVSRNGSVCNIYVRGADNALWQRAWFNNAWHPWGRHNDGGVLASEPAPGSMGPNHEHVFVRGTDNQVWQKFWTG